jgi:hypothetical protein
MYPQENHRRTNSEILLFHYLYHGEIAILFFCPFLKLVKIHFKFSYYIIGLLH